MLWFPVTHVGSETESMRRNATGYLLERAWLEWCYDQYLSPGADKSDPRLSPLLATSFAGLPPAYVLTAAFDPLHDEGVAYAAKLRDAGVDVEHVDSPDMVHVFTYLFAVLPQAPQALKDGAAALRAALMAG
jgi:acetyl esterase